MALLNLVLGALFTILGLFDGSGSGGDGGAAGDAGGSPDTGKPAGGSGSGSNPDGDSDGDGTSDKDADPEVTKWKGLARKHEGRLKALGITTPEEADELRKAAKRLKDIEDANKTELDKAKDGQSSAERRATEAESKLLRMEVAIEKGLSPAQAKRLVGGTRDELEADADELLEAFKAEGGDGRTKPATGLRSRSVPGSEPEDNDPSKLAAQVPRA
jgi:hypothetical protein